MNGGESLVFPAGATVPNQILIRGAGLCSFTVMPKDRKRSRGTLHFGIICEGTLMLRVHMTARRYDAGRCIPMTRTPTETAKANGSKQPKPKR